MNVSSFLIIIAKLYIGITASRSFALSACVSFFLLIQSVNESHFLNVTSFLFLPAAMIAASAFCPATVIVPFSSMYASR